MLQILVAHPVPRDIQIPRYGIEGASGEENLLLAGFVDDLIDPLWPVRGSRRLGSKAAFRVREISAFYMETEDEGWIDEFCLPQVDGTHEEYGVG